MAASDRRRFRIFLRHPRGRGRQHASTRLRAPDRLSSPLALRLLSAALGMPLIVAAILVGGPFFTALLGLAMLTALGEIAVISGIPRISPVFLLAAAGLGAVLGAALTEAGPLYWTFLTAVPAVYAAATVEAALRERAPEPAVLGRYLAAGGVMAAALLYLALPAAAFILIRAHADGAEWLLLAVLAVMATDAAAYAGGRTLGRRRLAAAISPNKTIEGALCGWLGGSGAVLALDAIFGLPGGLWPLILLALVLPLAAQIGDLAESLLKRARGVKDSSNLIPGHGGALDRLDSLLFGVPAVYLFLVWT